MYNNKSKRQSNNDIVFELEKIITSNGITLNEIYKKMKVKFEEDIKNKRWASISNFEAAVRRNIFERTDNSEALKYKPIFTKIGIGTYKKIVED